MTGTRRCPSGVVSPRSAICAGPGGRPLLASVSNERLLPAYSATDRTLVIYHARDDVSDTVRLWDAVTGAPVGEPLAVSRYVWSVAFGAGAGGRPLLASGGDALQLWDLGVCDTFVGVPHRGRL